MSDFLAEDPLDESIRALGMSSQRLQRLGRHAEAVEACKRAERVPARELASGWRQNSGRRPTVTQFVLCRGVGSAKA